MPYYTPGGEGAWPRHVTEGWMSIWDLAKPVIAQVHGYCLAGASELATGCDLVYMAEDAQMGYPGGALRRARHALPPVVPRHAQGDGDDAHRRLDLRHRGGRARLGQRRVSRPTSSTSACSRSRDRIAMVPIELLQLNKRVVHRQMDAMGLRAGIRAGTELCALGTHTKAMRKFIGAAREKGLTERAAGARRAVRRLPHGRLTAPRAYDASATHGLMDARSRACARAERDLTVPMGIARCFAISCCVNAS